MTRTHKPGHLVAHSLAAGSRTRPQRTEADVAGWVTQMVRVGGWAVANLPRKAQIAATVPGKVQRGQEGKHN